MNDLRSYFELAIEERRRNPREDLITALVRAEEESHALSARKVLAMCVLLLVAGNETTTNLIGNTVLTRCLTPPNSRKLAPTSRSCRR